MLGVPKKTSVSSFSRRKAISGIAIAFLSLTMDVAFAASPGKSKSPANEPLFSQDFNQAPPAEWLDVPIGPVYGFIYSKFGMRRGPYFKVMHMERGGIRNSPFVRVQVPNDYPYKVGSDHYFSPNMLTTFGEERFRVGNWRGCIRWSGDPTWSGVRQKLYYQVLDGFVVGYDSMRGGLPGRLLNAGVRSGDLRNTEITTNLKKAGVLTNRVLIFTSGNYAGHGFLIEDYNTETGRMRLFPGYDYERSPPSAGSNFVIGPEHGERGVGSSSQASGNVFDIQGATFKVLNESGVLVPGETMTFKSSGITATVKSVRSKGRAFTQNIYIVRGSPGVRHYGGQGHELVWGMINIRDQYRFGHVSPYNDAPVKGFTFYKEDHHDQWWCLEERLDYDQNPWRLRAWLTTEWGASNLAPGTAGRRSGTRGVDGDGIPEFNDFLYMDFQVAMPALQRGEGVLLTWGGYAGESPGSYQDFDSFSLSDQKIGHPFSDK